MASDTVISVEDLSKRYLVGHQSTSVERYTALRDVLGRQVKELARKTRDMLQGKQIVQGDEVEEFWALKDVSFEVKRGEVLGIIGRNGAGKSTLLKILSRITEPTNGRVTLQGRVASLLEVGTGFHPELSGRENIFLNGAILGMSRKEIKFKFDEIVEFAGVEKFLDTPVKRYSSGMYVRLAFAVAAHLEPEILIIDEVLAVGDSEFQRKCLGKMGEVATGGKTVLFVSHNMAAVQMLCHKALVLVAGKVSCLSSPEKSIHGYTRGVVAKSEDGLWIASADAPSKPVTFQRVKVEMIGQQPNLLLRLTIELLCIGDGPPLMIAVDLKTHTLYPLLQILPYSNPFIQRREGITRFAIDVDLPPLIPNDYFLDLWIGTHNTETLQHIPDALMLTITETPNAGRIFPHKIEHGHISPTSRVTFDI